MNDIQQRAFRRAYRHRRDIYFNWWVRGSDDQWYATQDHKGPYVGPHLLAPSDVLLAEANDQARAS